MKKIRILVVDDSVLFRTQIQVALQDCAEVEILGAASNGKIALEKMCALDADLCILDIEMPVMDGLETLKEMKARGLKTKAIMFSSQSQSGAQKTMEAFKLGAIDFVAKPQADGTELSPAQKIKGALYPKILSLFPPTRTGTKAPPINNGLWKTSVPSVLVVASSTGGPNALVDFFTTLALPLPFPVLVVQHMPPIFTASLAERIQSSCGKRCKEGEDGEFLKSDQIYIAPGDFHMSVTNTPEGKQISLNQKPMRNYVRPCADFLFESAVSVYGPKVLGVVLTGMGRDGADGAKRIKEAGGSIFVQDQASSVVFGMPGAVFEAGLHDLSGSPQNLAERLVQIIRAGRIHAA